MPSVAKSTFIAGPASIWGCLGRWPLGTRTLGAWAALVLAKLRDLAPYAMIELLLPGGSVLALTLWFYRRRKKAADLSEPLNI
jgi:hypothetical protein